MNLLEYRLNDDLAPVDCYAFPGSDDEFSPGTVHDVGAGCDESDLGQKVRKAVEELLRAVEGSESFRCGRIGFKVFSEGLRFWCLLRHGAGFGQVYSGSDLL